MHRRLTRFAWLTASTIAAALCATATPAAAIDTYNAQPAPERTEVGALLVLWDNDGDPATPDSIDWHCSGTMISATVFLTAAHCTTDWAPGARFFVSLAQDVQADLDAANAAGLSPEQVALAVGVEGTAHEDPGYPGNSGNPHDIAVVNVAASIAARWPFTPAVLPASDQFGALGSQSLDALPWLVAGYGTQEAARGPGGQTHPGGGVRMKAPLGFNAINPSWLRLAMNESRGYGGACYGDSGGPNFVTIGGRLVLAGITITGDTPCYATNVAYRLDTDAARTFLSGYVALP